MQKATLKISTLILCGLLIYNSLGYFLVLSMVRVAVRHEKWAQLSTIPNAQLTSYIFNKNKPDSRLKVLNDHEISINGKLFDVVRQSEDKDQIIYYCIHDAKEETLIAKTRQFNSMTQPVPVKNTTRLVFENIIKNCIFDKQSSVVAQSAVQYFTIPEPISYSNPVMAIQLPPPQSCC